MCPSLLSSSAGSTLYLVGLGGRRIAVEHEGIHVLEMLESTNARTFAELVLTMTGEAQGRGWKGS